MDKGKYQMNELVATYIFDSSVSYGTYDVYACYSDMTNYDNRKVDYYDVYERGGQCANEGHPFYQLPSWNDIYQYYWLPLIREGEHNLRDTKILEKTA